MKIIFTQNGTPDSSHGPEAQPPDGVPSQRPRPDAAGEESNIPPISGGSMRPSSRSSHGVERGKKFIIDLLSRKMR